MNKIITLIALLVAVTSAYAWDIDYSKYTFNSASVAVGDLTTYRKNTIRAGSTSFAHSWWSPDKNIVLTMSDINKTDELCIAYPDKFDETILYAAIDLSNISEAPPFLFMRPFYGMASDKKPTEVTSICAGPNCDRLITRAEITYLTLKTTNLPVVETFDYIGTCRYYDEGAIPHYLRKRVVVTPYIPTAQIPIYSFLVNKGENRLDNHCLITDIKIDYLKPTDEDAMGEEFAAADKQHAFDKTLATIKDGNYNLATATYTGNSPADVNNDKSVNSADVVSVYNYIMNGENNFNGHAYVDLGLPSGTLWATCNVGAAVPEAWGNFYAYREPSMFSLDLTNYNENDYTRPTSEPTMPGWEEWEYPTCYNIQELEAFTTMSKGTINGNNCIVLTSNTNGNQIVFPLPGYIDKDGHHNDGLGYYWTNELYLGRKNVIMKFSLEGYDLTPNFNCHSSWYDYQPISLRMICKLPTE